jgi:hypothetical protein
MRARCRAAASRGAGLASAGALALAWLGACSIGSDVGESFGSAASVGGNSQGTSDEGSSGGTEGGDDPDGSGGSASGSASAGSGPDDPPPGGEVCNGLDDDGDGMIDEDQPSVTCGVGSCEVTEPSCVGGAPQGCTPALPGGEVCNGLDDDCNGAVDDVQQACSSACGEGTVVCNGNEQACDAPAPQPEACNLADDDCNGSVDDGVGGCRHGIHRSLHPVTGEHFYTASLDEAQCCGFVLESANFFQLYSASHAGLAAFYRCYTPGGFHFYTQDPGCEGVPVNEGVMGYVATAEGTGGAVPLYRLYLGSNGDHFYTTSAAERDAAVASFGYVYEGVAAFVW